MQYSFEGIVVGFMRAQNTVFLTVAQHCGACEDFPIRAVHGLFSFLLPIFLASVYALIYRAVLRDRVYYHVVSYTRHSLKTGEEHEALWMVLGLGVFSGGSGESVHTMEICGGLNYHHQGRPLKSPEV